MARTHGIIRRTRTLRPVVRRQMGFRSIDGRCRKSQLVRWLGLGDRRSCDKQQDGCHKGRPTKTHRGSQWLAPPRPGRRWRWSLRPIVGPRRVRISRALSRWWSGRVGGQRIVDVEQTPECHVGAMVDCMVGRRRRGHAAGILKNNERN